jgi:hypothetical protein
MAYENRQFHAVMVNNEGLTFVLFFMTFNWYKIEDEVWKAYDKVKDQHEKYGPWNIKSIDVG